MDSVKIIPSAECMLNSIQVLIFIHTVLSHCLGLYSDISSGSRHDSYTVCIYVSVSQVLFHSCEFIFAYSQDSV